MIIILKIPVYLSDMDNHPPVHQVSKRKRTSKGRRVIAEGDDITADGILVRTVTHHTEQGSVQHVQSRPVWLNENKAPETVIADVPEHPMHMPDDTPEVEMDLPNTLTSRVSRPCRTTPKCNNIIYRNL